jgi:hypothetical protein
MFDHDMGHPNFIEASMAGRVDQSDIQGSVGLGRNTVTRLHGVTINQITPSSVLLRKKLRNLDLIPVAELDNYECRVFVQSDFSRAWMTLKSLRRMGRSEWPFWLGSSVGMVAIAYWLLH